MAINLQPLDQFQWPAQDPDLNPAEHFLDEVERQLHPSPHSTSVQSVQ